MPRAFSAGRRFVDRLSAEGRAGLSSIGWSYLTHGFQLVIRLVSSMILTHLLLPSAYGVYGVALVALFYLELLSDIGLRQVVVRSLRAEDPQFLGTAWSVIMFRGVGLSGVALALAWLLPAYNAGKYPDLHAVMLALCGRPLLISFQNPTIYVLYRRLNYRTPFFLDTLQTVASVPATILLALHFQNVWALVLGLLFGDLVRLVLSFVLCPPAPRPHWDRSAIREMTHFGLPIFLSTLAYGAWFYYDRLIGGPRLLSEDEIGLYVFAFSLYEAMDNLIGRGSEVFYSMLSRKPEADRAEFFARTCRRLAGYLIPGLVPVALLVPFAFRLIYTRPAFQMSGLLLGVLTARLAMRAIGHLQFMYLAMNRQTIITTRAYVVSLIILAITFSWWVREFGVLGVALSSVLAMNTFTLAQTVQMVWRREASPWPTVMALIWTAVAVTGVLLIYGH